MKRKPVSIHSRKRLSYSYEPRVKIRRFWHGDYVRFYTTAWPREIEYIRELEIPVKIYIKRYYKGQ